MKEDRDKVKTKTSVKASVKASVKTSVCDICPGGRVPRRNNVMNFLYMGPGSCMQYWLAGRNSQIPSHMCDIVRFLARDVCGCDIDPMDARLQGLAIEMIGGVGENGREPVLIPKTSDQLYAEHLFEVYNSNIKPVN